MTFKKKRIDKSVSELYKENIADFNPLILPNELPDNMEVLAKGEVQRLSALNIHNGYDLQLEPRVLWNFGYRETAFAYREQIHRF